MAGCRSLIYGNLAVMQDAGFPVLRALRVATSGMKGKVADGFRAMEKDVSAGDGFVVAMGKYPKVFRQLDVMVIGAGDASGNLADCFKLLSHWYGFCDRIRNTIVSGMMLPLVLLLIVALLDPVPALCFGRISIIHFFFRIIGNLALFSVPAGVIFAVVRFSPRTGFFRMQLDRLTLKMPVLGRAVRQLALSRYCHVFYMLFKGGLPIVQCAQMASEHTGNIVITDMLAGGWRSAAMGNPVSDGFSQKLDEDFIESWRIGEETGELDNVVRRQVEKSSEKAESIFADLGQWIPRLFYWLVSIFIVMSIFKNAVVFL